MTNFAILMRIVNVLKEEGFQLKLFVKLIFEIADCQIEGPVAELLREFQTS